MLTRSEAWRSTRAKALKQLAFLNAEQIECFSPKRLNVIRKKLFTNASIIILLTILDFVIREAYHSNPARSHAVPLTTTMEA